MAPQVVELEVPLMIQDNRLTTHLTLRELACITQSTHLEDLQMEEVGNQLQDLVILKAIKIKSSEKSSVKYFSNQECSSHSP